MSISIVIAAYNEQESIGDVIQETISVMDDMRVPYEIIVVDDGSTDETKQIAATYKATVLSYPKNRGKGYAMRKGFAQATGDIVVTMDADGAHNPKEIPDLVNPLFNGTDIVAGSRFLGSRVYVTSRLKRIGNFLINTSIMTLTGRRITDSQTGFRAFKKEVLEKLKLTSSGYDIESEITIKCLKNGFSFEEKPISVRPRGHSASKLRVLSDGRKILRTILQSNMSDID